MQECVRARRGLRRTPDAGERFDGEHLAFLREASPREAGAGLLQLRERSVAVAGAEQLALAQQ